MLQTEPVDADTAWCLIATEYGHGDANHAHYCEGITPGSIASPFPWLDAAFILACCNSVYTPFGHLYSPFAKPHVQVLMSLN